MRSSDSGVINRWRSASSGKPSLNLRILVAPRRGTAVDRPLQLPSHSLARQRDGLPHPDGELRLVERIAFADVEIARVLASAGAGRDGMQQSAAEERHL